MTRTLAAAVAAALAIALAPVASADPFDQRSFPCEEDEVLGYAPQFGPDRVGCIHIDELRGDLTYCPSDSMWSREWHDCPPSDPGAWVWGDDQGYDAGYEDYAPGTGPVADYYDEMEYVS